LTLPAFLRHPAALLAPVVAAGALLPGTVGAWLIYPALGVMPGLALAEALPLGGGPLARWSLGLAAAPLASAVGGWALVAAGMTIPAAAWTVSAVGWGAWLALSVRNSRRDAGAAAPLEPSERFAWGWSLGAALVVAITLFADPYLRIRSDSWVHGAIVWEIFDRGIPPQDPRFAGLTLNYVWFYNFFVALLTGLSGGDPFVLMAISNVMSILATVGLAWRIGMMLWGNTRAAAGSVMLLFLGLNAGTYLLWPLRLVRAAVGRDRGWDLVLDEISRLLTMSRSADVIFSLAAPWAYMVSFLDKFLLGTALNYAYLLMLLMLFALVAWVREPRRRALFWGAASACGMLLFHGVVGLSVIPVTVGALGAAVVLRPRVPWLPGASRFLAFALATIAGAAFAVPYTLSISSGWQASRSGLEHSYFRFDPVMQWTTLSACAAAGWLAVRPVRDAMTGRRPEALLLALVASAMIAFNAVVFLPSNNSTKFVQQVFTPLALLGGAAFLPALDGWKERWGAARARAFFALVFVAPALLTLFGYLADPGGRTSPALNASPEEKRLHRWIQGETPVRAVFVDDQARDVIMVQARRQLLLGSKAGPELAAFPLEQVEERREVTADLYGPLGALERDVAVLGRLGRPVYVLYRRADFVAGPFPADRLARHADRFARVYDHDGFVVYHLLPGPPAAPPAHRP